MMQFYMTPGSCSTGIHIILEELEQVFAANIVNLPAGEHRSADYLAINDRGTIPALICRDGTVLKDYLTIAWYLARLIPKKNLLPDNPLQEAHILDVLTLSTRTIHGEGFARYFVPEQFSDNDTDFDKIRAAGLALVAENLPRLENLVHDSGFFSTHFTIADPTAFYVCFWAVKSNIDLPPKLQAHYEMMLQRPCVRMVLFEEGYGAMYHSN